MTTEPAPHIQRAAAVIKDAAEMTPYWVPADPATHQDPWTNAALALEAQGLLATPPAPAQSWILLVCQTGNTNLMPSAVYRAEQAKWDAVGWVIVSEWDSREAMPGDVKRAKLKRQVMIKQGWLPEPSAAVLAAGPGHPDHPEHEHEDCCK
jgi:hypothetical protein